MVQSAANKSVHFTDKFTPLVVFVCTGFGHAGQQHNCSHVGATQERLKSWPQLQGLRRKGRDASIPARVHSAWRAAFRTTEEAEKGLDGKRLVSKRKEMIGPTIPIPTRLIPPLHDFRCHAGQAFLAEADGRLRPIPCCYMCKFTLKFCELCTDRNDLDGTLARFDMRGRKKYPASCAEVAWIGVSEMMDAGAMPRQPELVPFPVVLTPCRSSSPSAEQRFCGPGLMSRK